MRPAAEGIRCSKAKPRTGPLRYRHAHAHAQSQAKPLRNEANLQKHRVLKKGNKIRCEVQRTLLKNAAQWMLARGGPPVDKKSSRGDIPLPQARCWPVHTQLYSRPPRTCESQPQMSGGQVPQDTDECHLINVTATVPARRQILHSATKIAPWPLGRQLTSLFAPAVFLSTSGLKMRVVAWPRAGQATSSLIFLALSF